MATNLVDRAAALLRERGPMPLEDLADALGEQGVDVDDDDLAWELEGTDQVWELGDGRCVAVAAVLDGAVLTHRLTPDESEHGFVTVEPDLELLIAPGWDGLELASGAPLELVTEPRPGLPLGPRHTALVGPEGWLAGLAPGDCIGLRRGGDRVSLERVEPGPAGPAPGVLAATFRELTGGERLADMTAVLAINAAAADPSLFATPRPPLGELLAQAGLEARGDWVATAGMDWESWERASRERHYRSMADAYGFTSAQADAFGRALIAIRRFLVGTFGDEAEEAAALAATAAALADAEVAAVVGSPVLTAGWELGEFDRLVVRLAQLDGRRSAGVAWMESLAAEWRGDTAAAEEHLREALDRDPAFGPALEDAAWDAGDRGDASRAASLLRRAGVDPDEDEQLQLLDSFAAVRTIARRNDPCPCGSGRKYKACCARRGGAPLEQRVPWLLHKLVWFSGRRAQLEPMTQASEDDDANPAAGHLALFDGGVAARFAEVRGPLLPDDERALAEEWAGARHRLFEVADVPDVPGGELTLRDVASSQHVRAIDRTDLLPSAWAAGARVFALVLPAGRQQALVGSPVVVPADRAGGLMELLEGGADVPELAACVTDAHEAWEAERAVELEPQRAWLFPPVDGEYDDIDLALLDPADEDDRAVLIEAEHPELGEAIEVGVEEVDIGGEAVNPRLHLAFHEVVATRIWEGDPPELWETAQKLTALGHDRHEVLHMLGAVVARDLWAAVHGHEPPTPDELRAALHVLPGAFPERP